MPTFALCRRPFVIAALFSLSSAWIAQAQVETLGTYYRPDEAFPQFNAFWKESGIPVDAEAAGDQADYVKPAKEPAKAKPKGAAAKKSSAGAKPSGPELAGSLHVFVRNTGNSAVRVDDIFLSGLSLKKSLAFSDQRKVKKFASIYFAKLAPAQVQTLIAAGEPVWWKVDPPQIAPGAMGEVIVRLRQQPRSAAVAVGLQMGEQKVETSVAVSSAAPRLEGISFTPELREAYLYFRHPNGAAPNKITLDGQDITAHCKILQDRSVSITPVIATLPSAMVPSSFHVFGGSYADKSSAMAGLRAWSDEFVYGTFGGKPGNKDQYREVGKAYIDDLTSHSLNLQMPQIGSGAIQEYFKDPQAQKYMDARGFRFVLSDPGKFGIQDAYAIYVHDEPDCGDYRAEGLPSEDKKVGVLAQWCISHADEIRENAPDIMQMLNLNMTYKPYNWYIYGQIPDIFTVDPYYQVRLKDVYHDHPERKPLYEKATYIYMVSSVAQSSGAPNPLHVILYGNRQSGKKTGKAFRFPTAPEKRIEAYYAVAAGAKGLSYWWYTPGGPADGLGAATLPQPDPAAQSLWREIGLVGAEMRTAGPVLMTSCPVEVPVEAPKNLWVRFLASGDDTLVMFAVNEQYANTDKGTDLTPVKDASVTVTLPEWMKRVQTFEITAAGTKPVAARAGGEGLRVPLGDFDATKMIVITANAKLRSQLQGYYESKLAGHTAALLKRGR